MEKKKISLQTKKELYDHIINMYNEFKFIKVFKKDSSFQIDESIENLYAVGLLSKQTHMLFITGRGDSASHSIILSAIRNSAIYKFTMKFNQYLEEKRYDPKLINLTIRPKRIGVLGDNIYMIFNVNNKKLTLEVNSNKNCGVTNIQNIHTDCSVGKADARNFRILLHFLSYKAGGSPISNWNTNGQALMSRRNTLNLAKELGFAIYKDMYLNSYHSMEQRHVYIYNSSTKDLPSLKSLMIKKKKTPVKKSLKVKEVSF